MKKMTLGHKIFNFYHVQKLLNQININLIHEVLNFFKRYNYRSFLCINIIHIILLEFRVLNIFINTSNKR